PFGALAYYYKHPVQRLTSSKWEATGTAGAFLGYQSDMKAYREWDPSTQMVVKTCNVDVIEKAKFWKNQKQNAGPLEEVETDDEDLVLDEPPSEDIANEENEEEPDDSVPDAEEEESS